MESTNRIAIANVRYLVYRTGAPHDACAHALLQSDNEIIPAFKILSPHADLLPYPEWYYMGPFERIEDPGQDLPRRTLGYVVSKEARRIEMDGLFDGERLVAPFHDGNTLEDIQGPLYIAQGFPSTWSVDEMFYYPTIQGCLAKLSDRVRDRIKRSTHRIRTNWFRLALDEIESAKCAYANRDNDQGYSHLKKAEELLTEGNKAHRRKVAFIVSPDGKAQVKD